MFRRLVGVVGNVPALISVIFGPILGLQQGHLKFPDILLSDLLSVKSYKEVLGCVAVTVTAVSIYLWIEVFRYTRSLAPLEVHRPIDFMIAFLAFMIFPGALLVVFFPFEEYGLDWFLHCFGASMVFGGMAGIGFVYMVYVSSTLEKHNIVPKEDAWYRKVSMLSIVAMCAIGAIVRPFHVADQAKWAWVLLAIEVAFALLGLLATVLGNWQTWGILDREQPVAFAEVSSPAGAKATASKKD